MCNPKTNILLPVAVAGVDLVREVVQVYKKETRIDRAQAPS